MTKPTDADYPPVAYEDIPLVARLPLSELYSASGVEDWWNTRNTALDNQRPAVRWNARSSDVLLVIDMLTEGNYYA